MREPMNIIQSTVCYIPSDNIDTDQIIPAKFLKTISEQGFGDKLFYNWRFDQDGNEKKDCVLNQEPGKSSKILFAGKNFGCGSSREHAPWALRDFGFKVIIAQSFADIFRNNAQKNGLLLIKLAPDVHQKVQQEIDLNRGTIITIDLPSQQIIMEKQQISFEVDA